MNQNNFSYFSFSIFRSKRSQNNGKWNGIRNCKINGIQVHPLPGNGQRIFSSRNCAEEMRRTADAEDENKLIRFASLLSSQSSILPLDLCNLHPLYCAASASFRLGAQFVHANQKFDLHIFPRTSDWFLAWKKFTYYANQFHTQIWFHLSCAVTFAGSYECSSSARSSWRCKWLTLTRPKFRFNQKQP